MRTYGERIRGYYGEIGIGESYKGDSGRWEMQTMILDRYVYVICGICLLWGLCVIWLL